ncbi:cytochrome P450 family protein [Streptosporangium roseum]|uniref:Cytochrome P450-family protein n=1 Tax=Streptosporangium roseum (strain ATCC 12428 / DSM 43021 / JCM 3005 / KCTC 9067 / NCIMB 10171 / NRRL 2505 / NI 9100) TaxID=479432 RepID=D2B5P7_STRRD|nr:cytochrome P450 [Streptosporangium roseum]ACZ91351.1 cytochrome P450-family protein [Streptosporangium roseum DSM 43021]
MSQPLPFVIDPTGADRHAEYQAMRARGPATPVDILGLRAWAVTDPALLKSLLTSPDVSKNGRAHYPAFQQTTSTWPLALWIEVQSMLTAYGADHRRLRRMVAPAFSARRIAELRPTIQSLVAELIDDLAAVPPGQVVDLRERLAYPLPIAVIGHLMGVPEDQRDDFRQLVDNVFDSTLTPEQAKANTARLFETTEQLIATKRSDPGDDMTSLLIAARDEESDGTGLTDVELRDTMILMINAGYETTVNVIDQAVFAMLTSPDQLHLVRTGQAAWEDVVEETLRAEPAIKYLPLRFAVTDIRLPDGQVIAAGDPILAAYGAANRHPGWHGPDADTFDVTRKVKDHLAFGYGVHFCLGAPLARLEVAEALRQLFERFPAMSLAVPADTLRPVPTLISNGHQELPVRLRAVE